MIVIEKISKKYGSKLVLNNVSFTAHPGEKIALVGRNGCGKSTLLRILAGIQPPDTGKILYYGKEPLKQQQYFRTLCGYVPQDNPLLEELSVQDNLKLWGGKNSIRDTRLLGMFELDELLKVPVCKLSGGMKRRVTIACAVSRWPSILIMDEPTNAVDIYYKEIIHEWMNGYIKMNGIILFSTHNETEIEESKKCLLLCNGSIQELEGNNRKYTEIYEQLKKG